ncbi:MAG TPA: [protein-PII] uridylyltransferase [candidate division Zixibacteria bacterium]|nr:[protein-PII] uridylyltransferase [candidate division Zixibacteria bacterium]
MDAVALSHSILEQTRDIADPAALARAFVKAGRAALWERHRAGAGGTEIASAYATMMDHLIRHLFSAISEEFLARYPTRSPNCAVVAQGGYGRGELCPYSDIDLLFLHSWKPSAYVESVTEKLLYALWDAGLQVGHATRSVADCIRLGTLDLKVKTALLDARYLCGDFALYQTFEAAVEHKLARRRAYRFIQEKLAESRARRASYGGSVYMLQPEIKEGEGGLRDIHTARWIARVKENARDFDDLVRKGIVSAADVRKLKEAQDFLLRVRNELHFSAGKHQDQLTFDDQERVSRAFGYEGEGKLKGVEVFMRQYYLQASEVSRVTSLIIHRLTESQRSFLGGAYSLAKTLRDGVVVHKGQLRVTRPEILRAEPGNLMRVFADLQKSRCELSHETRELLRDHLDLIDEKFRRSAAANLPFFEILKWKDRVYETLLEMHRCGVLGAFIPEFGRLLCMALHDAYHVYTVDQHSLRLIQEIERLKSGAYNDSLPLLTQLAREADKIELLYLGLLFHDIGKGFGGGHSEIGARMVRQIARRMRLNVDDTALVEFLVRHHLLMTHTAFRRDLEDEKTIIGFARTMGSIRNLKMLYLLTFADVKAVGPDVWNPWKASLLGELYVKALDVLEEMEKGELPRRNVQAILRRTARRLRRRLEERHPEERVRHFLETMPDRYFLATPEDEIAAHFELMEQFTGKGAVTAVQHFPEKDCSSFVVCAMDRPGLFAAITGVLAAMNLDILNARIFTASDGRILDVFRVAHRGRSEPVMDAQKWERVRAALDGVLAGRIDVARLVASSPGSALFRKRVPKVATSIEIDNEASDGFTIVEVYTEDRIGVLFTITYALHRLGLSIHVAKISTNVDQVADVFYVTDERGEKIHDAGRLEAIRRSLYETLAPQPDEGLAQPAR